MALKIRLARGGSKKRPYYRIVVADVRNPRDGRFIEKLGTYNPLLSKESNERVTLQVDRIKYWLGVGAKPTDRVLRFLDAENIAKRPPRNNPKKAIPKKDKEEAPAEESQAEAPAEAPLKHPLKKHQQLKKHLLKHQPKKHLLKKHQLKHPRKKHQLKHLLKKHLLKHLLKKHQLKKHLLKHR